VDSSLVARLYGNAGRFGVVGNESIEEIADGVADHARFVAFFPAYLAIGRN